MGYGKDSGGGQGMARALLGLGTGALIAWPGGAQASFLHGEALDDMADVIAWVVLIIGPIIGIALFWMVHILPEKMAEKRGHPQAPAIQMLCLLSLVFGGLLWPLAFLWAVSKPVLHQMAYGTDKHEGHGEPAAPEAPQATAPAPVPGPSTAMPSKGA